MMKKEHLIMVMISVVSAVSAWGITRMLDRRMGRGESENDDFRRGRLSGSGSGAGNRGYFDDDGFSRRNRILAGAGVGSTL